MDPIQLYFDTNVYAEIVDSVAPADFPSLRSTLARPPLQIRLSPINVLEFLSTPDPVRRETLILLAQEICSPDLLVEVESIITHYVAEQSNAPELRTFLRVGDHSTSELGLAWREAKADRDRTLLVDPAQLERFRSFKALFAAIHAHFRRGDTLDDLVKTLPWFDSGEALRSIEEHLRSVAATRRAQSLAPDSQSLTFRSREAAAILMAMVFCTGLTPFERPIDSFWEALKIPRGDRLLTALSRFPFVLDAGPIVGMALAMAAQWLRKTESGNAFDIYHLAYLPMVHMFITCDVEMLEMASMLSESKPFRRVKSFKAILRGAFGA